jgi:lysophospholipase L1-like esterase
MKNLYIMSFLSFITFLLYITNIKYKKRNKREYFTSQNKTIILLGDSVLNNNSYVEKGKTVNDLLEQKIDKNKTIVPLARNNSTINKVYHQLERVNRDLNDESTTVFLSVGGNDILKMREKNIDDTFDKYNTLVDAITTKLPNAKLVLFNVYYPPNKSNYHSEIKKWNTNLDLEYKRNNKNIHILNLAKLLKDPSDFVDDIEPSITGGEKIVNKIINM